MNVTNVSYQIHISAQRLFRLVPGILKYHMCPCEKSPVILLENEGLWEHQRNLIKLYEMVVYNGVTCGGS